MARPFVLSIEVNRVAGHQTTHEIGKICGFALKKKMKMIRQECPRQATGVEPLQIYYNPAAQLLSVVLIGDNIPFLNTPCVNMMKRTGEINSRVPRHGGMRSNKQAIGC